MAGIRMGGRGGEGLPAYPWLLLLVLAPYLLFVVRTRPFLVALAAFVYIGVVLPMALHAQLPQGSLLWLPRTVLALLFTRSALYTGLATSLGSAVCWAAFWTEYLVRQFLRYLLRAIFMPLIFVFGCVLPLLHNVYLAFDGFRTTSNQVVFFLMVQQLVTPLAHLTALYFLLFYTVLHYLHKSLFTRQWARTMQTTEMRDLMRLTAWYMAVRLGKGVAMSFVLVMFTLQFNHVESDLVYIVVTFIYFVVSQRRWTGNERIVSWSRALDIEVLEEEEEFWVPVFMRGSTVVASLCVTVPLALSSPWLVMMAAYTNLLVPGLLLRGEYLAHISRQSVLITKCRRATPQEIELNSTCPVCLEELRQARLTPCRHLYHAACLRKCLTLSPLCPLCKQTI
ncbi:protein TRC8 homolog isoform X2 [Homarus americanus]|uniref:protein TRC8 homolog isoform X2 n=1 Tax=Homarus americanus TaxID=6706 RepID=UPI001C4697DD|nr:protein TRC8 homolog isoform X2 [Homarus americanus]